MTTEMMTVQGDSYFTPVLLLGITAYFCPRACLLQLMLLYFGSECLCRGTKVACGCTKD